MENHQLYTARQQIANKEKKIGRELNNMERRDTLARTLSWNYVAITAAVDELAKDRL